MLYIYILCMYIYIYPHNFEKKSGLETMIKKTFSENFQMAALDHGTPMGCEGKGGPAAGIPNLHGTGKNGGF